MKKVEAWKCDFCPKCYTNRRSTATHQRVCRNNPTRHNCVTCAHSRMEYVVKNYPSPNDYYQPAEIYEPWCDYHEKPIGEKPYFIDCDEDQICSGDEAYYRDLDPDEVFRCKPGTCHHYEYKGYAGWGKPKPENGGTP